MTALTALLVALVTAAEPWQLPAEGQGSQAILAAADDSAVYWTEPMTGRVRMLAEGRLPATMARGRADFAAIAASTEHLFWAERPLKDSPWRIVRMRKDPGSTIFVLVPDAQDVRDLAASEGAVAWTTFDGVFTLSAMGGPLRAVAKHQYQPHSPVIVAGQVCWANTRAPSAKISEGSGMIPIPLPLHWMERAEAKLKRAEAISQGAGRLSCAPLEGGKVRVLEPGPEMGSFATDGQQVYWSADGKLWTAPFGGGAKKELLSVPTPDSLMSSVDRVSVRAGRVVWVSSGTPYLLEQEGAPRKLADPVRTEWSWSLVQTEHAVYWTTWSGYLWSAPLPGE